MSCLKSKILISCILAGILASPLSALASTTVALEDQPSRVVKFGDLDLDRESGIATLYSRIRSAAREVCEPMDAALVKLERARFDCRGHAIAKAIADVNSSNLTAYYRARTKTLAGNVGH
jgi:UrcA family protein